MNGYKLGYGLGRKRSLLNPPEPTEQYNVSKSALTMSGAVCTQIAGKLVNMVQADTTKAPEVGTDTDGKKYFKMRPSFPFESMQAVGLTIAQPFTISFVVRQLTFTSGQYLFNFQSGPYGIMQANVAGTDPSLAVNAGFNIQGNPGTIDKLNERLFITYVINGVNSKMFIGNDLTYIPNPGALGLINPAIGRINSAAAGNYDLFDVQIFNRELTFEEHQNLYKSQKQIYKCYDFTRSYAFGDSIAFGGTYGVHSFFVPTVKSINDVLINYAIPGAMLNDRTVTGVINQYRAVKLRLNKSNKIFIHIGTNDIQNSQLNTAWNTAFRALIDEMITDGFTPANIYLTTPPYKSTQTTERNLIKSYFDTMATDYGVKSVDMIAPTQAGGGDALLTDGVHPNATGVGIMAAALTAAL